MRSAVLFLPFILVTGLAAQSPPACGEAALEAAPDSWDAASAVTGDFTLDGKEDVAFWTREEGSVLLYVVSCDGDRPVESWRFRLPLVGDAPPAGAPVQVISPLMDTVLVDRVCASGEPDECEHMRQENRRRQSIADSGGRELRVGGSGTPGIRLRWSPEMRGFMRIGG